MHPAPIQRGFTLLIAIIVSSVALALGLALADIAYKQVLLSSSSRQSEVAFYAADSALECALYYDQKSAAFDFQNPIADPTQLKCGNNVIPSTDLTVMNYSSTVPSASIRKTTFDVPCANGTGLSATVTIYKADPASSVTCNANGAKSCLYSNGYNTCTTTDTNRFERGLKVLY